MNDQDLAKIAPDGLKDLNKRVSRSFSRQSKVLCESCGAENSWVFSDLKKTKIIGRPMRTGLGPLVFICSACHKQTRIIKAADVGLRDDIEVKK